MENRENDQANHWTWGRILSTLILGFAGASLIWIFAPYINFVIGATNVTDHYLPPAALFLTFFLVLCINPLLRKLMPRFALTARQLAVALGIFLMACVTPGMGLLSHLPYTLVQASLNVSRNKDLANAYRQVGLKAWLFPDKLAYGVETPVADHFNRDLPPGEPIPWKAWLPPLAGWGSMLIACWLMMIGLGMIVYPQWRRNERLAFPLIEVYRSVIEDPGPGRLFPPIFRKRLFWIAVVAVFWLQIQEVVKLYLPSSIPAIPLRWDLSGLFTEEPLVYLPWWIMRGQLYFVLIGVSYFMPTRISFSIWIFVVIYSVYQMLATAYFPPFQPHIVTEHRVGALFGAGVGVLWLGRAHWAHVFRCVFRGVRNEQERRERHAGIMFLVGILGMIVWLTGVGGVPFGWSIALVGFAFFVALMIARIVSETGMPYLRLDYRYQMTWVNLAPLSWISPAVIYFAMVISTLFPLASLLNPTTMTTQIAGFDEKARPRQYIWLSWALIAALVGGLVISGASHLWCNYNYASTIDGKTQPISYWGTTRMNSANSDLRAHLQGRKNAVLYNRPLHIGFGVALAGTLQYLSLAIPKWPLHPVGLLIVYSWFSYVAWQSVFLGWLLKLIILRYGGAHLYRAARPAFLGIIVGTVFAAIGQTAIPIVRLVMDLPYLTFT